MARNGEVNETFGIFRSLCCGIEITLREKELFPDCPRHRNLPTVWKGVNDGSIPKAIELRAKKNGDSK